MTPTELCCLCEYQHGNSESLTWKHLRHTTTSLLPKNLYCLNLLASNHQPPLCRYPSSKRLPTPAWKRHSTKWQWYVSPTSTANNPTSHLKIANFPDRRRPVTLIAGLELRTRLETALKISRRYNLQSAIAWLNETAFPAKRWRVFIVTVLGHLPFARTDRPKRTGSHLCKWKGQDRSVRLLTRSLHGIHVNNMADLATKHSNIPPTLLRDFLSPEEEDTFFWMIWKRKLHFLQLLVFFIGAN